MAAIHDAAVRVGGATFRTAPRPLDEVEALIREERPFLVATRDSEVVGWAAAGLYEPGNPSYDGVAEVAVYVAETARGAGAGTLLLAALAEAAEDVGIFKLVAKVFTTNTESLRLFERAGYATVGTHFRHGCLRGEWRDVVVLEKLLS
ncbi:MAG: GNAT family N-acetyltransferase [Actinomycetota bacterium]|nr:GNAT family N-acetyltransferase [Actinomycetota bacterium]